MCAKCVRKDSLGTQTVMKVSKLDCVNGINAEVFHYLTLNLACQYDRKLVKNVIYNDIEAMKTKLKEGVCVDSFGEYELVSFIKRDNLTNFE